MQARVAGFKLHSCLHASLFFYVANVARSAFPTLSGAHFLQQKTLLGWRTNSSFTDRPLFVWINPVLGNCHICPEFPQTRCKIHDVPAVFTAGPIAVLFLTAPTRAATSCYDLQDYESSGSFILHLVRS